MYWFATVCNEIYLYVGIEALTNTICSYRGFREFYLYLGIEALRNSQQNSNTF